MSTVEGDTNATVVAVPSAPVHKDNNNNNNSNSKEESPVYYFEYTLPELHPNPGAFSSSFFLSDSFTERYFDHYFYPNCKGRPHHHLRILQHSNGMCVLCLDPRHALVRRYQYVVKELQQQQQQSIVSTSVDHHQQQPHSLVEECRSLDSLNFIQSIVFGSQRSNAKEENNNNNTNNKKKELKPIGKRKKNALLCQADTKICHITVKDNNTYDILNQLILERKQHHHQQQQQPPSLSTGAENPSSELTTENNKEEMKGEEEEEEIIHTEGLLHLDTFIVPACVAGTILERNTLLEKDPLLAVRAPLREGYLALLNPSQLSSLAGVNRKDNSQNSHISIGRKVHTATGGDAVVEEDEE